MQRNVFVNDIENSIPTISDDFYDETNYYDTDSEYDEDIYEKPTSTNFMRRMIYNISSICAVLIIACICYWAYYEARTEFIDYDDILFTI